MMNYIDFFRAATGGNTPYLWQCRLACGEPPDSANCDLDSPDAATQQWLSGGNPCVSRLVDIPTGMGKTAGVVLAWLWNRIAQQTDAWPRRLVYCLPMRTLVEQTEYEVEGWLANLWQKRDELNLPKPCQKQLCWMLGGNDNPTPTTSAFRSPIVLMGGEDISPAKRDWDIYPEEPAILIGTQDMLLSRALNRGYGMSRYRWPMHFALLNNDCLWVMDEVQLMGPGLATACQLEAFRKTTSVADFGSFGKTGHVTWYMSATNNPDHLQTREWRNVTRPNGFEFGLTPEEKSAFTGPIHQRRFAAKQLELKLDVNFEKPASLVAEILERHSAMLTVIADNTELPRRTLIICNTVDRAVAVHRQLATDKPEDCDLLLLHSRFRPPERREQMERLKPESPARFPKGQIVVATQVIEAGVDLSSGVLWSEIAPLSSLVQRLGRLNRAGEFKESKWMPLAFIVGVGAEDAPSRENKESREKREKDNVKRCLPYELPACEKAWDSLRRVNGSASPADLEPIQADIAASIPPCPYSLQRHELFDFFDTDANLSLGFTDVSPFVRGLDDDTDLQVLWRVSWLQQNEEEGTGEPGFTPDFQRVELCPVPIGKAKAARDILNHGWLWRGKNSGWVSVRDAGLAPGMTILLPLEAGGYDNDMGWTGQKDYNVFSTHYQPREWPSDEDQLSSLANGWQSIAIHTRAVEEELRELLRHLLSNEEAERKALLSAVPWHDIGKNHPGWQQAVIAALEKAGINGKEAHMPFAKFSLSHSPQVRNSDGSAKFTGKQLYAVLKKISRYFQPTATHEVASALAFRQAEQARLNSARDTDLASLLTEYIIMSHHGRVRKVLRDEIPKSPKNEKDTQTVRGIRQDDELPTVQIGDKSFGGVKLSTDCRKMGRDTHGHESYTRGVLRLLDHYGPFRLAYFEAIFRAADMRASAKSSKMEAQSAEQMDSQVIREDESGYRTHLSPAEQVLVADLVADGLEIQHKFRPEPLYKQTGRGHYESGTVKEIQKTRREIQQREDR